MRVPRTLSRTAPLLALLTLAACSGGGDADPRTAGPRKASVSPSVADPTAAGSLSASAPTGAVDDATRTLRNAPEAAREAGTVRFDFEQVFESPNGRGVLRGSGVADLRRSRARLVTDYHGAFATPPPTTELTIVTNEADWWARTPAHARATVGKEWLHAPLDFVGYGAGPLWPVSDFVGMLRAAEDVREVRPNVFRAVLPPEAAARTVRPELYDGTSTTLRQALDGAPLPVEVELDGAGRPIRVELRFTHVKTQHDITSTLRLRSYGSPVDIALPDPAGARDYPSTWEAMAALGIGPKD